MSSSKKVKLLQAIIKPYGLLIISGRKHRKVCLPNGQPVYYFPSSPSEDFFAYNALHGLIKLGLVPRKHLVDKQTLK